jgi:hypothetical protein
VLQGPLVAASEKVRLGFDQLKPAIQRAFAESGPPLLEFTDGFIGFAQNAMPGFNAAIESSGAPMRGLSSLLVQTGAGLTDFFVNATEGAAGAERGLIGLGGIIQDFLGFTGQLFANLANGSGGVLPQFQSALQQVEHVLLTLTSNGMPALQGATGGFLSTVSGGLGIINGLASGLGSWTAPLGAAGGQLLAINSIARIFGTSLGETGFGLKAFATTIDETGKKTSPFRTALADTEAGGSKLSRGLGAVASSGFNPLGLAIVAGGLLLSAYGAEQEKAAKKVQEHKQEVNNLTEAIRQDNGVVGESARAVISKSLADKNAAGNAQALGISLGDVTLASEGNTAALQRFDNLLSTKLRQTVLTATGGNTVLADGFGSVAKEMATSGESADVVIGKYSELSKTFNSMSKEQQGQVLASLNLNQATKQQIKTYEDSVITMHAAEQATKLIPAASALATAGSQELAGAFDKVASSAGTATDKGSALVLILDRLSGRAPSFEEATQSINDQLRTLGEGFDKASKETGKFDSSMINADGTVNTFTANGSKLQDKLNALEKSTADSAGSFADMVKAGVPVGTALQRINDQATTTRDRFVKSAEALGFSRAEAEKLATAYHLGADAMGPMLAGLSDQDLATAKVTKSVDALGNAVYTLPDGKKIKVDAETEGASAKVNTFVNETEATTAKTTVGANIDPATSAVLDWKNTTFQTRGDTTTYTNTNPATGAVTTWKVVTDATGARTTTATTTDPATGAVANWKRNADGTWARTNVDADMGPADRAARDWQPPNKNATIYYFAQVVNPPGGYNTSTQTGRPVANAKGDLYGPNIGFADGGFPMPTKANSFNGMAQFVPPGTFKWAGDAKVPELFAPLDGSAKTRKNLIAAAKHEKILGAGIGFADGGLVGAASEMLKQLRGDGQFFEDFSYYGNSDLVSKNNDALAKMFYAANPGFDFNATSGPAVEAWLEGFLKSSAKSSSTANVSKPAATQAAAKSGGNTITNYNTFNLPPDIDIHALASLVSRELEMRMKTGAYGG